MDNSKTGEIADLSPPDAPDDLGDNVAGVDALPEKKQGTAPPTQVERAPAKETLKPPSPLKVATPTRAYEKRADPKAEDDDMDQIYEGMVIVLGFLHCLLRVNPFAALCLFGFLFLKAKKVPRFVLTMLFTLLAVICPMACAEIALLLLDPPVKVCKDISNCFRDATKLLENRISGMPQQKESKKKK